MSIMNEYILAQLFISIISVWLQEVNNLVLALLERGKLAIISLVQIHVPIVSIGLLLFVQIVTHHLEA